MQKLTRVEQLAVGAGADLVDDSWLQVQEDAARHMLAGAGLRKEGVEGIVATADGLVRRHLAIGLNTVLQAVELPAGIANLCKKKANKGGALDRHSSSARHSACRFTTNTGIECPTIAYGEVYAKCLVALQPTTGRVPKGAQQQRT